MFDKQLEVMKQLARDFGRPDAHDTYDVFMAIMRYDGKNTRLDYFEGRLSLAHLEESYIDGDQYFYFDTDGNGVELKGNGWTGVPIEGIRDINFVITKAMMPEDQVTEYIIREDGAHHQHIEEPGVDQYDFMRNNLTVSDWINPVAAGSNADHDE